MKIHWIILFLLLAFSGAQAEIIKQTGDYYHGDVLLKGYLCYDDTIKGERPGVLIVHEWTGLTEHSRQRAEMLAKLGYLAFAVDMYGDGKVAADNQEAAKLATIYRSDRKLMRDRVTAGLEALRSQKYCDTSKIAAIGYCFGGGTVLELARSGADIRGVVSFHGNLDTPDPKDANNIKAKILVCHGAADPHVPREQVETFQDEMEAAGVDWQMIFYGGAVHSFTNKNAGNDPSKGVAYDADADRRSWQAMQDFFNEIFNGSGLT